MPNWALPLSTAAALDPVPGRRKSGNPGLVLDRLLEYPTGDCGEYKQEHQQKHLDIVCEALRSNANTLNSILAAGWEALVSACDGTEQFSLRTIWRLAMHLSRATAVENASLCLHPVYGFPYLPGTGLKGLASTWAKLHGPGDNSAEFRRIFGTQGGTGSVLFLEAWPAAISSDVNGLTIEVDIVNSHHPEYYRNRGIDAPPGDWESPNPVYFLAVAPNVTFRFAVAKTRPDTDPADIDQAKAWLISGLTELGFGAKTAAGYGYFAAPDVQTTTRPAVADDPLEAFRRAHAALAGNRPDKSAAGQAITDVAGIADAQVRRQAADWVYQRLEAWHMLNEKTKKNPEPYGERLKKLMEASE
ncbi:MAG: type III-B CRISPR module RAMP protein Cmr6 [Armatimonadota bacterium]